MKYVEEDHRSEVAILQTLQHYNDYPLSHFPTLVATLPVIDETTKERHGTVLAMHNDGNALSHFLKYSMGQLTPAHVEQMVVELINGVALLHSLGIVHRDIKPDNLIYSVASKPRRLTISDYSSAQQLDLAHASDEEGEDDVGTANWTPPEMDAPTGIRTYNKMQLDAYGCGKVVAHLAQRVTNDKQLLRNMLSIASLLQSSRTTRPKLNDFPKAGFRDVKSILHHLRPSGPRNKPIFTSPVRQASRPVTCSQARGQVNGGRGSNRALTGKLSPFKGSHATSGFKAVIV